MKIYVGKHEAVIKLNEKGRVIGIYPDFKEDDMVPGWVQMMAAITILLKERDEQFMSYVNKKWKQIVEGKYDEKTNTPRD